MNEQDSLFNVNAEKFKTEYKKTVINTIKDSVKKKTKISSEGFHGWLGGKKAKAEQLISILPPHKKYIEIFMGSAAVFFTKQKVTFNIINDINDNLVNLYEVLRNGGDQFDNFLYILYNSISSKTLFDEYFKQYKNKEFSKLAKGDRAAIYYYLLIHTFNNDMMVGTYAHNDSDFTKSTIAKIMRSREKLKNVIIENMDYTKLIKKYNQKNSQTLFFGDPPYVVADDGKYYEYVFSEDDHRMFAFQMQEIHRKGNHFVLTYDNVPLIRQLYKQYNIMEMEYTYSSSVTKNKGQTKKIELVITNNESAKQISMF